MTDVIGTLLERADAEFGDARRRLGVKLKLARQTKGLTLRELASRSRCSFSLLSKVENGKALPSLALIHRLVRVLETNISWLFEETEPQESPIYRAGERPLITLGHAPPPPRGAVLRSTVRPVGPTRSAMRERIGGYSPP